MEAYRTISSFLDGCYVSGGIVLSSSFSFLSSDTESSFVSTLKGSQIYLVSTIYRFNAFLGLVFGAIIYFIFPTKIFILDSQTNNHLSIFQPDIIIVLTEIIMTDRLSKKKPFLRKKSIICKSPQAQQPQISSSKKGVVHKVSQTETEHISNSEVFPRKSDDINRKTYFNCQNYFLRKTILVLYNFFEKIEKSWNLEHLSYKNMIALLKELRYVKNIDNDIQNEQNEEQKKCYYLWVNITHGKHVSLENILIILCHIEHLQIDEEILKEVIVELQKGISKFEEETIENGNPDFIFLCKREGWKIQNNKLQLTDKQVKSLRKELESFRYTRWTETNPVVKLQEESEQSLEVHFMSKKSIELANNKRKKIQEDIRQRQNIIETIQLHHILNYKEEKMKFTVSKLQEYYPYKEQKESKVVKVPTQGPRKENRKKGKSHSNKGSNKENRNMNNPHRKLSKPFKQQGLPQQFNNQLGQDLGLSEIVKTQIIEEIDSLDEIPNEDDLPHNNDRLNNTDFQTNFFPQSMIVPQSSTEKKRRQYIDIPMLYVDVNIEEGKKERIVVYDGDTAEELALAFGKKHGLSLETVERLEGMLKQQIGSVLCKIDEALEEDCSYLY